ncbi:Rieske 2Fe-2S domain-containing protein [Mesorhizobium sp.]|uniref:Rieske (2Fe-2S) protein n=1 Tax=Mesorhizobium sp. TaxID=1871066 RepID=UPI00342C4532
MTRTQMAEKTYICRADEIQVGAPFIAKVRSLSIGVFRIGDSFHALLNVCPHRGAPLCEGPHCGTTVPLSLHLLFLDVDAMQVIGGLRDVHPVSLFMQCEIEVIGDRECARQCSLCWPIRFRYAPGLACRDFFRRLLRPWLWGRRRDLDGFIRCLRQGWQICRKAEGLAGPVARSGVGDLVLLADGGQRGARNSKLRGDFAERPVTDQLMKLQTCQLHWR